MGLLSGSFDYLAELREVTTMFMSWDNYDETEHRNLLSLQKYFFAAQKVLAESAGFVRQFLVDDKGEPSHPSLLTPMYFLLSSSPLHALLTHSHALATLSRV